MATKTILSAPMVIAEVLTESPEVSAITTRIIPVGELDIESPYVVFRREKLKERPVKGTRGPDTAQIELLCASNDHEQSLELAEAVREALDGSEVTSDRHNLRLRECYLVDATEYREGDAYVQQLKFITKV